MNNLNLDEGKIRLADKWYSAEDLTRTIQHKIQSGDMKFADLAAALERLNIALENSHRLEVSLVISKDEYAELKAIGGMDDRECIRKAIMAFIGYDVGMDKMRKRRNLITKAAESVPRPLPVESQKTAGETVENAPVTCFKCKSPLVLKEEGSGELKCPKCSEANEIKASFADSQIRYKDHFLG